MKSVEKVLAYITRERIGGLELLVFDHQEFPEAGVQIPAGSVERNEEVTAAVLREIFEESGLKFENSGSYYGRYEWLCESRNELHLRNVFHFVADQSLPEEWLHVVEGHGEDKSLAFKYYWLPLEKCEDLLAADQGKYLRCLEVYH
jgi:8-oxo-dGTP pyrophosphatase MutT (NUDIX family)